MVIYLRMALSSSIYDLLLFTHIQVTPCSVPLVTPAPDRWGRVLMRRAERRRAERAGATPHTLMEIDYLLMVDDEARQGALRFARHEGLWCMGKVAVDAKYHYHLQANTTRHKIVLSNIYLAMQIVNDQRYKISNKELRMVFDQVSQFTNRIDDIA